MMPPPTYKLPNLTAIPITPETLSAEIKSTSILRVRLEQLSESVERELADEAKEELESYEAWIRSVSDGGSVNTESQEGTSIKDEQRAGVLDEINEIKFRRKYITNQLRLLSLQKSQEYVLPILPHPNSLLLFSLLFFYHDSWEEAKSSSTCLHRRKSQGAESRISKLQKYNEIKDIAQELMGLVADNRNVTVKTLYESGEFGVDADD
ncbi:hypothetical protein SAPIO_CDS0422 [Scedosporium apiospermum]|uniref:Uncharacterized protein n=1 Tax=Pseudallescheria apiosperma TaxID=563466 RepID=A0A084GGZ3_PSEDA|nr:uncharacterized protein SAPIO_CDS0422 [Scedosporium apiospermum]KEZ46605.1 hypothetical protein SAPIO_CDS0422 [Scedosporium apiospermum]